MEKTLVVTIDRLSINQAYTTLDRVIRSLYGEDAAASMWDGNGPDVVGVKVEFKVKLPDEASHSE